MSNLFDKDYLRNSKNIDLRYCSIDDDELADVSNFISDNNGIRIVDLRDNKFSAKNLEFFLKQVEKSRETFEELYLGYNNLGGQSLFNFFESKIANFKNLKKIYINNCFLTDEDFFHLTKFLVNSTQVKELDISCNNLSNKSVQVIADLLEKCHSLVSFYFSYNQLTEEHIEYIGETLGKNPSVQRIYARCLDLRDTGVDLLTKTLYRNSTLKYLNIGDNEISDIGFIKVCQNLLCNKTLSCLNVGRNKLTAKSMETLAHLLKNNRSLKEINLGKNNISDVGMQILNKSVGDTAIGLSMFNVRDNNISEKGVEYFSSFIEKCKTLEILNLCDNSLGTNGVEKLCLSVIPNNNIKYLYIGDNNFKKEIQEIRSLKERGVCFPFFVDRFSLFAIEKEIEPYDSDKIKINISKNSNIEKILTKYKDTAIFSINFDELELTTENLAFINCFIMNCSSLNALSFQKNNLDYVKIEVLVPFLHQHPSLKILDFKQNKLGKEGTKALAKSMGQNKNLEFVDLSYNYVGFEFIEEICFYHKLDRLVWKF
jgi:Ran GTPase-activating protein (RanGAP) involved in mRNA processing and transport